MKMGTRVSQYVHFIIYQTASETRGVGCEGLGKGRREGAAEGDGESEQGQRVEGRGQNMGELSGRSEGGVGQVGVDRIIMRSGLLLKRSFMRSKAVGEGSVAVGELLKVKSELGYTWRGSVI